MLLGLIFKTKLHVKMLVFFLTERCGDIQVPKELRMYILNFVKKYLAVGLCTSNVAVYGELGRFPLHIIYMVNLIKYWLKITQMPMSRYPKSCYIMLYKLDEGGRTTWATYVKMLLNNYGFSHVLLEQGVSNIP